MLMLNGSAFLHTDTSETAGAAAAAGWKETGPRDAAPAAAAAAAADGAETRSSAEFLRPRAAAEANKPINLSAAVDGDDAAGYSWLDFPTQQVRSYHGMHARLDSIECSLLPIQYRIIARIYGEYRDIDNVH